MLSFLTQNMERNQINYELFCNIYERFRKKYDDSFNLSEEEKIRIKGFAREIKSLMESRKLNFNSVFQSKDRFSTGFITSEDLLNTLLYELYMNQSPDMHLFVRSLNPMKDGKISLSKLKEE